jgi:hypothetical protein
VLRCVASFRYCGVGLSCPSNSPTGRGLDGRTGIREEILKRHNDYRDEVRGSPNKESVMGRRARCLPELK